MTKIVSDHVHFVKENGILVYFIDMKVVNIYKGLSMIIGDKYQKT